MHNKVEKEKFYIGHSGSYFSEILLLIFIFPLTYFYVSLFDLKYKSRWKDFIKILILVFPIILSFTIFSNNLYMLFAFLILPLLVILSWKYLASIKADVISKPMKHPKTQFKIEFLTLYRVYVLFSTFICILAVDFPIFPRRFAKSENFGLSFMDIGVGAFVFCNAMVSSNSKHISIRTDLMTNSNAKLALKLFLIGLLRTILVKAVGYHEHVSEYGSHWNFFITLSLLKVIEPLIDKFMLIEWLAGNIKIKPFIKICDTFVNFAIVLTLQQLIIKTLNFQKYFDMDPKSHRTIVTFLMANREGLLSLPGYLAIYLTGQGIGKIIFLLYRSSPTKVNMFLIYITIIYGIICVPYIEKSLEISRRMCNLPYILILCFINLLILAIYSNMVLLLQKINHLNGTEADDQGLFIKPLEEVNKNGLMLFLIANVLTGLINMFADTQHASPVTSFVIIFIYMCIILSINFVKLKNVFKIFNYFYK